MKNNKGVTLVALGIMIIILLILASVGIHYSREAINLSKLTHFTTELEIMESQARLLKNNNNYQKQYTNYLVTIEDANNNPENLNILISEIDEILNTQLKEVFLINTDNIDELKSRFRYFSKEKIKSEFNIEGIENNFIINIQDGIVICKEPLLYKGVYYYSLKQLEENDLALTSYTAKTSLKSYQIPYIPDGYYYVGGSWDTGFVISDESSDKIQTNIYNRELTGSIMSRCKGNLYVWVPIIELDNNIYTWGIEWSNVTSSEDYSNIESALNLYLGINSNANTYEIQNNYGYYDDSDKLQYYQYGNMSQQKYEELYHSMLKSIYLNGGFYVGAYEMGINILKDPQSAESLHRTEMKEYISSENNNYNTNISIVNMSEPISKANATPYTNITQPQAQMLAEKVSNSSSLNTSLLFDYQWKILYKFIEKFDSIPKENTGLLDRGYYYDNEWIIGSGKAITNHLCTTGASDENSILNIYDLKGNISEYIVEGLIYSGNFNNTININSAIKQSNNIINYSENIGARIALWK